MDRAQDDLEFRTIAMAAPAVAALIVRELAADAADTYEDALALIEALASAIPAVRGVCDAYGIERVALAAWRAVTGLGR